MGMTQGLTAADAQVRPTPQQLAWQDAELTMFLHFGMNTFTNREWGEGTEDPALFNPVRLDAGQWARAAREAGFKYLILTAKHHDGFCLWPSKYTRHSVQYSKWRDGQGDVVREVSQACHDYGLKFGFYLSPWDRHEPTYGDSEAYNRHFVHQLEELLTGYGPVAEVWFDGANGEGPNGKKQVYDWQAFYATIRKHQPEALIAVSGPDIRWVGNEDGFAHETEWCVQPANPVYHGAVKGDVWWPSECDVSIRPGWFWHAAEDRTVKSLDHLLDIYFRSVGHNSVLLLNVPPNREGLLADPDVQRLQEFKEARERIFAHDLARGHHAHASSEERHAPVRHAVDGRPSSFWSPREGDSAPFIEVDLGRNRVFNIAMTQEWIAEGQRVQGYRLEACQDGVWRPVTEGTTIGHKKLDRFPLVHATRVRLVLMRALARPQIRSLALYYDGTAHQSPAKPGSS